MRPTRKRMCIEAYLNQNQDIDESEMVEDNEDQENVENLVDTDDDRDYVPGSPDVQVLEEDADDDDGDDPASPKMGPSKKCTAREEARNKRNQNKLAMQEAKERAKKVTEEIRAKKASRIRSPTPSRPDTPASHESDDFSPRRQNDDFSPRRQKQPRMKTSMVWNHLTENDEETKCKHCDKSWKKENSKSSTSNFRTHIIQKHNNKLSEADRIYLSKGDPKTPRRTHL